MSYSMRIFRSGLIRGERQLDETIKIMIVEDDESLAKEMESFLVRWGYEAVIARKFDRLTDEFGEQEPHLVLMDINLPYYDGFYWCSQIRQSSVVPILYISSRNDDRDKIMAIAQGGDDYVEKPFRLELLKAKIEALLRRTYQYKVSKRISLGSALCFDVHSGMLFCGKEEVELTKSERKILAKLLEYRPDIVTREELMMNLWNTDEYVSDGTLTTMISRLRSKLKSACGEEIIQTRKGLGYFIS